MSQVSVAHIITKLELGGAQKVAIHTALHLNRDEYSSILISGVGGVLDESVREDPGIKSIFVPELIRMLNQQCQQLIALNYLR